ncbi:hypothetical protein [Bacillus mesophilum]|uniref:Helix-hairpin-helix DNA-binding motif class 1 domain-containing protein n=1 Tax=Bacillus mesophilum TaxID=1071718 RepID=A0A7V7UWK6_9BACI|nr:hypothetical protein [Bacillus mesophilum]KAB2335061.1 hypothetical protein F7732_00350 [Bacillus mesophilum]
MGSALRQLKKNKSPMQKFEAAYDKGYMAGAGEQKKADVEHVWNLLQSLEQIPGIGPQTAEKVRQHFLTKPNK